jgi:hypothetical protein
MSKETFYFSHDYNARTDDKIKRLIRTHGMTGYGIFWSIVEDLYNNANALRLDCEGIAYDLHTDCEVVKSVINDFDLFTIEDDKFGSFSIERRITERDSKSEKARESAFKRWNKKKDDANALPTECDSNAIKDSIVKDNIENEIIKKEFDNFWDTYNKKKGNKEKIFKKWCKLKQLDRDKIFETLPVFIKSIKDKQYQPYPETYLNDKRWNDEINIPAIQSKDIPTVYQQSPR